MKILPVTEMDIEEILPIERLSFSRPWSKYAFRQEIRSPFSYLFCAKLFEGEREVVAGYIGLWLIRDEAHITNLSIHPRFRRRGYASELLDFIEDFALERGGSCLTLEVRRSNYAAIDMYLKRGFEKAGIRRNYYFEEREDALIMTRDLVPRNLT